MGEGGGRRRAPLKRRRAEREFFFWTAFKTLELVAAAAFVVDLIVLLIEGRMPMQGLLGRL